MGASQGLAVHRSGGHTKRALGPKGPVPHAQIVAVKVPCCGVGRPQLRRASCNNANTSARRCKHVPWCRRYSPPGEDNGQVSDDLLSRAVRAFVSGGHRPYPTVDEEALVAEVGEDAALDLLPTVRAIAAEVFDLPVDWASIRREPYLQVEDAMQRRHPELDEAAVRALGNYWAYQTR